MRPYAIRFAGSASICASRDPYLSLVGFRVIEHMGGDEFVGVILSEMMDREPYAWKYLVGEDDKKSARRLKALAEAGKRKGTFWICLADTWGFEPALVEAATAAMKELPAWNLPPGTHEWVETSLVYYLRIRRPRP